MSFKKAEMDGYMKFMHERDCQDMSLGRPSTCCILQQEVSVQKWWFHKFDVISVEVKSIPLAFHYCQNSQFFCTLHTDHLSSVCDIVSSTVIRQENITGDKTLPWHCHQPQTPSNYLSLTEPSGTVFALRHSKNIINLLVSDLLHEKPLFSPYPIISWHHKIHRAHPL